MAELRVIKQTYVQPPGSIWARVAMKDGRVLELRVPLKEIARVFAWYDVNVDALVDAARLPEDVVRVEFVSETEEPCAPTRRVDASGNVLTYYVVVGVPAPEPPKRARVRLHLRDGSAHEVCGVFRHVCGYESVYSAELPDDVDPDNVSYVVTERVDSELIRRC